MKITIDLNVIVEVLLKRQSHEVCSKILTLCKRRKIEGRISSHGIPTIYYVVRQKIGHEKALRAIDELNSTLLVTPVDNASISRARELNLKDFEDALVAASAIESNSNFIVTKNVKDFSISPVPAMTPEQFMEEIDLMLK